MRWSVPLFLILVLAGAVRADDQPRSPQVAAAAASTAANNLLGDIQSESIDSSLTVAAFLDKTNSRQQFITALQQAQQIGGPRWIDDQTCQVQLEISGPTVMRALADIAATSKTSPLSADQIRADLKAWDKRVFSATGAGTSRIDTIHPPASATAWAGISDKDVHRAVAAARQNAVSRVLDSLAAVPLASGKKISDAMAIPEVSSTMAQWLGNRPVTLVDFRDDHHVELTLSVSPANVSEKLRSVLAGRTDISIPTDDKTWAAVTDAISHAMATPVGLGAAAPTTQPASVVLPSQPPDWIQRQLDVEATAAATDSKLHTARNAEKDARGKLRDQVRALALSGSVTLGDAADQDPRLAQALDRALSRVHVYNVDYKSDDTVSVRISMDLRDLWEQIAVSR